MAEEIEGVDYSFSVPSARGLADAGKRFAGRYVGPGSGKFLTPAERDALFANGLDIFLLVEGSSNSAAGGYQVGVQHAQLGRSHARQLGAPEHVPLYYAVDYDIITEEDWSAPREYLRGACDVDGVARVGVYGDIQALAWAQRDGVASWFFQTTSAGFWSQYRVFPGNHIEQYQNGVNMAGGNVDLCRSKVANFGQWRADGANPGQIFPSFPEQEGDDDMRFFRDSTGGIWLQDGVDVTSGKPILWPVHDPLAWEEYVYFGYSAKQLLAGVDWRWWVNGENLPPGAPTTALGNHRHTTPAGETGDAVPV